MQFRLSDVIDFRARMASTVKFCDAKTVVIHLHSFAAFCSFAAVSFDTKKFVCLCFVGS